jgi:uncharacterized protein YcgL (UPF0745 family)
MKKSPKPQQSEAAVEKKGVLSQVGEELKENLKTTPQEVTHALVQDAKQAVNYEIRRGFRNLISGLFKR